MSCETGRTLPTFRGSKRLPLKEKALQGMFPGQDPGALLPFQGGLATIQGLTDPGFMHAVLALRRTEHTGWQGHAGFHPAFKGWPRKAGIVRLSQIR